MSIYKLLRCMVKTKVNSKVMRLKSQLLKPTDWSLKIAIYNNKNALMNINNIIKTKNNKPNRV